MKRTTGAIGVSEVFCEDGGAAPEQIMVTVPVALTCSCYRLSVAGATGQGMVEMLRLFKLFECDCNKAVRYGVCRGERACR